MCRAGARRTTPYGAVNRNGCACHQDECTKDGYSRGSDAAANGQLRHLVWTNRGKESFFVEFKNSDDATVLRRLLTEADGLVQSLASARWGGESLRKRQPCRLPSSREPKGWFFAKVGKSGDDLKSPRGTERASSPSTTRRTDMDSSPSGSTRVPRARCLTRRLCLLGNSKKWNVQPEEAVIDRLACVALRSELGSGALCYSSFRKTSSHTMTICIGYRFRSECPYRLMCG